MDEIDDKFLQDYNVKHPEKCTEDEFEYVMSKFEEIIIEIQPFLRMHPSWILPFEDVSRHVVQQIVKAESDPANPEFLLLRLSSHRENKKAQKSHLASFRQFGHIIYPHWKSRKIQRQGNPISSVVKYEDGADDSDPYVAFRRREVRQVRKTRRTDLQCSERIRKLLMEMQSARELMEMVARRENMRREALKLEMDIFESRCKFKTLKRSLGIKGDDEDLVTHKKRKAAPPPKRPLEDTTAAPPQLLASQNGHSIPPNMRRSVSKNQDVELVSLESVWHRRDNAIASAVKEKLRARALADKDWVNYTDDRSIPFCEYFDPDRTSRNALHILQPSHAAYSSITTQYPPPPNSPLIFPSSFTPRPSTLLPPYILETEVTRNGDITVVKNTKGEPPPSFEPKPIPRGSAVAFRKRASRGGRMMVDRKGLVQRPPTNGTPSLCDWNNILTFQSVDLESYKEQCDLHSRLERLDDRYKYDSEAGPEYSGDEPSKLNGISEETQSLRFGSMLMSKSYDLYWDAYKHRQQQLIMMHRMLQQQQYQANDTYPTGQQHGKSARPNGQTSVHPPHNYQHPSNDAVMGQRKQPQPPERAPVGLTPRSSISDAVNSDCDGCDEVANGAAGKCK